MKRIVIAGVAALSLAASAGLALAGPGHSHDAEEKARAQAQPTKIKELTVEQLSKLMADGKVVVYDANGAETRAKFGTIPGAKLLASSSSYELSELPSDKSQMLVFYCANTRCTASDKAAERAREAGYDVAVLRVGIAGWHDAGKETTGSSKS